MRLSACPVALLSFFNDTAPTEIYTLSLHDALPIFSGRKSGSRPASSSCWRSRRRASRRWRSGSKRRASARSEEHTSELQSHVNLVCRLLLEKKKKKPTPIATAPVTATTFFGGPEPT